MDDINIIITLWNASVLNVLVLTIRWRRNNEFYGVHNQIEQKTDAIMALFPSQHITEKINSNLQIWRFAYVTAWDKTSLAIPALNPDWLGNERGQIYSKSCFTRKKWPSLQEHDFKLSTNAVMFFLWGFKCSKTLDWGKSRVSGSAYGWEWLARSISITPVVAG